MKNEAHRVKRAIIMAAGMGNRMLPLTNETPKPLVKVNGLRMLDSVVEALHKNKIYEIHIVIGYLKDEFYRWGLKYPDIDFIENPFFDTCNNISSLYVARHLLEDCMILDADQVIVNPQVLHAGFDRSGYSASWCEYQSSEWILQVEENLITSCSRNGGSNGWRLYSISRWSKQDGHMLAKYITQEFEQGNRQIYWDDVPIFIHADQFRLGIYKIDKTDVLEIDSLKELIEVDGKYSTYLSK